VEAAAFTARAETSFDRRSYGSALQADKQNLRVLLRT
jgi:hypothetical protein